MNTDQETKTASLDQETSEFREDVKSFFGNASIAWGFVLGFLVHKYLLSIGKLGFLWRIF